MDNGVVASSCGDEQADDAQHTTRVRVRKRKSTLVAGTEKPSLSTAHPRASISSTDRIAQTMAQQGALIEALQQTMAEQGAQQGALIASLQQTVVEQGAIITALQDEKETAPVEDEPEPDGTVNAEAATSLFHLAIHGQMSSARPPDLAVAPPRAGSGCGSSQSRDAALTACLPPNNHGCGRLLPASECRHQGWAAGMDAVRALYHGVRLHGDPLPSGRRRDM